MLSPVGNTSPPGAINTALALSHRRSDADRVQASAALGLLANYSQRLSLSAAPDAPISTAPHCQCAPPRPLWNVITPLRPGCGIYQRGRWSSARQDRGTPALDVTRWPFCVPHAGVAVRPPTHGTRAKVDSEGKRVLWVDSVPATSPPLPQFARVSSSLFCPQISQAGRPPPPQPLTTLHMVPLIT